MFRSLTSRFFKKIQTLDTIRSGLITSNSLPTVAIASFAGTKMP